MADVLDGYSRAKEGKNIQGINVLQRKADTSVSCYLGEVLVPVGLVLLLVMMHISGNDPAKLVHILPLSHNHCQGLDLWYFKLVNGGIQHESKSYYQVLYFIPAVGCLPENFLN